MVLTINPDYKNKTELIHQDKAIIPTWLSDTMVPKVLILYQHTYTVIQFHTATLVKLINEKPIIS